MPASKQRRIAIFGTFDVENYGDLLFPLLAQQRLAGEGIDVVAVSPTAGVTRYRDTVPVIAVEEFANTVDTFDGILIGGGNIVHIRDFGLPGYSDIAYPSLWAGATAHAVRHDLPVAWNAPGVLAPEGAARGPDWLQHVAAAADRFAVRDAQSADAMDRWTGRRPEVMPDTATDLPLLWSKATLKDRFARIRKTLKIPKARSVIALHVKARSLRTTSVADFAQQLDAALEDNGATAVLIAIGRCHGDHELVRAINNAAPRHTIPFEDADTLQDIAAVIAGSDAYLGASLHGQITAAAYDVPARLVAVPNLHKFEGQAIQMDRADDVVGSWETALMDLPGVLGQPKQPLPASIASQLDAHWGEVTRIFASGRQMMTHGDIFPGADIDTALADAVAVMRHGAVSPPRPGKEPLPPPGDTAPDAPMEWDAKALDRMMADQAYSAADKLITSQLAQTPSHLPARLAEVRLAMARDETQKAVDLAAKLVEAWPDNPWVWNIHLKSLSRAGQSDAAMALFHAGLARPDIDETMLKGATGDVLALIPLQAQIAFLKTALEKRPQSTHLMLRLAMRADASGDFQLALDLFRKAEQDGPLPDYAAKVRKQLHALELPLVEAVDRLQADVEAGAEDVVSLCRLCRLAAAAGRFDLSVSALRRALELHPLEWRTVYRLNRVFLTRAEDKKIFADLKRVATTLEPEPSWLLQYALFALRAGSKSEGRETLVRLDETELLGPTARSLLAALDVLGKSRPRKAVLGDGDVRIVRKRGAEYTVVVFEGLIGGLSYINSRYLDTILADLPAHIIYLRDPHGQIFLKGVPELGADETAMQTALASLIADLGAGKVVAIGGSAAGYAALRTGLAIDADTVISLAGFVTPSAADAQDADHARRGMAEIFGTDLDAFDLRPQLRSHPKLQLTQVVGGSYAPDMKRLRAIDEVQNARTIILDGIDTHHIALPAITDGTLKRLLNEALSETPACRSSAG
ncbi:hypothetical protein A8B82_10675 [Sulfitobacter sp. EhC04]|uniref:polysaccharide pyruvyl transferase family protein n=1 Tax=Sulfitobacter sp. EhC04 TaxID=1849168 RepID=UPI0007F3E5FC|nr:polysaccharide pyruvyl transferase family protein [Sulfitobacter sp. EhC04]OAN78199.1 hypothetical protein A8B82_10675 [Sulfitobacter sp. EhC04]